MRFVLVLLALIACAHATSVKSEFDAKSLAYLQSTVEATALTTDPIVPQASSDQVLKISQLANPLLPGSEMIGMGMNLKEGIDLNAMTRPFFRIREVITMPVDENMSYSVPSWQLARRVFKADIVTKVFSSTDDANTALGVEAGLSMDFKGISMKGQGQVQMTKDSSKSTYITKASVDVQLYQMASSNFAAEDLQPALVSDFMSLPISWTDNPLAFDAFLQTWGTHYLKGAKVGGQFEMVGTTTTDKSSDSLQVAAQVSLQLSGKMALTANAKVDYKATNAASSMDMQFDFHARGGDPAVGGMLAQASSQKADITPALQTWLASVKKVPTMHGLKLMPIQELFNVLPLTIDNKRRQTAIKQAIDVYLKEGDPTATVFVIKNAQPQFSNFWRLTDSCLSYQATIGKDNKFIAMLTTSASRLDIGYKIETDAYGTRITKNGKLLSASTEFGVISPGSSILYSSYVICYDTIKGNILFGRQNRVMFAYQDPNPAPALFYGFDTRGPESVTMTAVQLYALADLTCPAFQTQLCGGPDRGVCTDAKMCQCGDKYKGYACNYDCPLGADGSVCSNAGKCVLPPGTTDGAKPYCECSSGNLGVACEIPEVPTLGMLNDPAVDGTQNFFSGRLTSVGIQFFANDTRALGVTPTSYQLSIQDADHLTPWLLPSGKKDFLVTLPPGPVTVTAQVTYPHNPDVVKYSRTSTVVDCKCSNKGECNSKGQCVCDPATLGDNCEDDIVTGLANIGVSRKDRHRKFVFVRFARKLGDVMKSISFRPYQAKKGLLFNFNVISSTTRGVYIRVTRLDKRKAWTDRLRVVYKVRGLRFIDAQAGHDARRSLPQPRARILHGSLRHTVQRTSVHARQGRQHGREQARQVQVPHGPRWCPQHHHERLPR